jgi:protein CpxP
MKKTLILLAALAFTTAGTAFAQTKMAPVSPVTKMKVKEKKEHKTPEQKADHGAAKMAKELGLNADQEARIEKIMLARQQEMNALKDKYGKDHKAGQTDKKALRDKYDAQFKEVLTAEQYTKFSQMKDQHHGHGKGKGHGDHGDGKMKMKAKS